MDNKTLEKIKEIQSAILMIDVSNGDGLDKKYKKLSLELLDEIINSQSE